MQIDQQNISVLNEHTGVTESALALLKLFLPVAYSS